MSMGLLIASASWAQPDSDRESREGDAISEITVRADRVADARHPAAVLGRAHELEERSGDARARVRDRGRHVAAELRVTLL